MGYSTSAISGFSWQTALRFSRAGLTAIKLAVVGRMLLPSDFGLFSLVMIAIGLTEAFTQTGINIFLLNQKRSIEHYLDTAWVIAIVRGLLIACLMLLMGLVMQSYFQQPILMILVGLASLIPMIKGFINPAIITLQKDLRFGADGIYHFSLAIVETVIVILLAMLFPSVYVLIIALILTAVFEVLISFIFFKIKPQFSFSWPRAQDIFHSAKWLNLSATLSYLHENLDNVLIGKATTPTSLGFYDMSYSLGHKPNYEIAQAVHHTTLPIFTKIVDQPKRLRQAFIKSRLTTIALITSLSLPLLIMPELLVWLLGNQWIEAVVLVRPLTLAGIVQSIGLLGYTVLYAEEKYTAINLHLAITTIFLVVGILLTLPTSGLLGAAWSILITRALSLPVLAIPLKRTLYA